MSKKLAYIILSAFALASLMFGLLVSPLATPLFRLAAVKFVDGLEIQEISGSLASSLEVQQLTYRNTALTVNVDTIEIEIDWQCSTTEAICIETLSIGTPNIVLPAGDSNQAAPQSVDTANNQSHSVSLPIGIRISALSMQNVRVAQQPLLIELSSASMAITADTALELTNATLSGLTITSNAPTAEPDPFMGLRYQAPELPDVTLPIPLQVRNFNATNLTYQHPPSDSGQHIAEISMQRFNAQQDELHWQALSVVHEQASLESAGDIRLSAPYPLSVELTVRAQVSDGAAPPVNQQIKILANGDLSALNLDASLSEGWIAQLHGSLNILDDSLPAELSLNWPEQILSMSEVEQIAPGSIELVGNMQHYNLDYAVKAELTALQAVAVEGNLQLMPQQAQLQNTTIRLLGGEVSATGDIDFAVMASTPGTSTRVFGQLSIESNNLDLSTLAHQDIALTTAKSDILISQYAQGFSLVADLAEAVLQLPEHELNMRGVTRYISAQNAMMSDWTLSQPDSDNEIIAHMHGVEDQYFDIDSKITLPDLTALLPGLQGNANGIVKLQGDWLNPDIDISVAIDELQVDKTLAASLTDAGPVSAKIAVSGPLSNHKASIDITSPQLSAVATGNGVLTREHYVANILDSTVSAYSAQWRLLNAFALRYQLAQDSTQNTATPSSPLSLPALNLSAHCWAENKNVGRLCVNLIDSNGQQLDWHIAAHSLPVGQWIADHWAPLADVSDTAVLSFVSEGDFSQSQGVQAESLVLLAPSAWTFNENNPVTFELDTIEMRTQIKGDELDAQTIFASTQLGEISTQFQVSMSDIFNQPVNGNIVVNKVTLDPLAGLSPSIYALSGQLDGELALSGTLLKPELRGEIAVNYGNFDVDSAPVDLRDWQQTLQFRGQQADIDGSYKLGNGAGTVKGFVSWEAIPYAVLQIAADAIQLEHEQSKISVSPNLLTTVSAEHIAVVGEVDIPYARLKIDALPQNAVTTSDDVHVQGEERSKDPLDNMTANISITLDKANAGDVKLDAFGLTADLGGELAVNKEPALVGYGDLNIQNGRYRAYGQNLIIRNGQVQFNGPLSQPALFVEAIRDPEVTEDNVIAGIRIDGSAKKPNVSLFSEPAMDQSQNLMYLLNGSGSLRGDGSSNEDYQAALVGFGLSRSGTFTGAIGDALGIEDLSFTTTGQGANTQVSMTGRLAKNLSVRFGVGLFDSSQEVAVRYQILPQLYLEAIQRLSDQVSLIDLYYQFTLGEVEKENDTKTSNGD